jgi:Recombinase
MLMTRVVRGATILNSSSHLPVWIVICETGDVATRRARLSTMPLPTRSETFANTIGVVLVARSSAAVARVDETTMTSGLRDTSSAAQTCTRSGSRGTGILNNQIYIGKLVWNKLRYVKDPETCKRRSKVNKAEAIIEKDVPHLRIVEEDLWDAIVYTIRKLIRGRIEP